MPIIEVKKSADGPALVKVCQHCKETSEVKVDSLEQGTEFMPEGIMLPACPKCGAVETLIRSTDSGVPEHASAHRKSVNAVSEYLLGKGKVAESSRQFFVEQKANGVKAVPLGELYARVAPAKTQAPPAGNPLALAMQALAAAQAAVEAAKAAQQK